MGISEIIRLNKKGGEVALVNVSEVKIYGRNLSC